MKYLIISLVIFSFAISACQNEPCKNAPSFAKCSEKPDTGTTCLAVFQSWFYDQNTGKSTLIGYSGCEQKGFETKEESEKCSCYRLENE